ncbi:MAG TPA: hypothetical protein VFJ68_03840 [Casimicrobiaceae bacterium]|nr:hypothetical protein [Casimicrobiaceae bacterium]
MRTAVIIVGGLVLLGLFALAGWRFGGGARGLATASIGFVVIWLVIALANMWVGVTRAGYSVAEELPIFAVIFAVPAAVAAIVWWKTS